jgi:flagellar hook-length control protein FliK
VNALDMVSGFTASAGPIGGADTNSADAGALAGGFDALIARVLGEAAPDAETVPGDTAADEGDEGDAADSGDLTLLIAMTGGVLIPPVVVDLPSDPPAALAAHTPAIGATGTETGVGGALDTLPCTLTSSGSAPGVSAGESLVMESPVTTPDVGVAGGETPAVAAGSVRADDPPAPPVVAAAESAAEAAATPSPQVTTDLSSSVPTTTQSPVVSPDASAVAVTANGAPVTVPTAGAGETPVSVQPGSPGGKGNSGSPAPVTAPSGPHTEATLRAALSRAGRARTASTGSAVDAARTQAMSELRSLIGSANSTSDTGAGSAAATPSTNQAATPGVVRSAEQQQAPRAQSKSAQGASTTDAASAMVAGIGAAAAGSGSSFEGGGHDGSNARGQASAAIDSVTVSSVRTDSGPLFALPIDSLTSAASLEKAAGVSASEAQAPEVTPLEHAENVHTVVRSVRMHFNQGGGEARLQLNPEHLGQVTLTVKVDQGSVAAHIQAESPDARRWIESNQQELRSALEDQGLEVKELVVTTDPDGQREREQQAREAFKPRPRRREDGAAAPKFEVVV